MISRSSLRRDSINASTRSSTGNPYSGLTATPFFCQGSLNTNVFIPCYMRMTLNNIKSIEMKRLTAVVEGYLELTLNLFEVCQTLSQFIIKNVMLEFTNGNSVTLSNSPLCLVTRKNHLVSFIYGTQIPMILSNRNVFLAPFDLCTITASVVISCNTLSLHHRKFNIRFNLMDSPQLNQKFRLQLSTDGTEFKISQKHLSVTFSPSEFQKVIFIEQPITLQQELDRSKAFHYAMYVISQYRFPGVAIITLFVPIWLFAFANLAIFFQTPQLHDRISSIATLMIAYTAFIPFLRQRLPLTPEITFLDINLYSLISTCLACLFESIDIRNISIKQYKFDYKRNPAFLFCVSVLVISISSVFILLCIHKIIWEPSYNGQLWSNEFQGNEESKGYKQWEMDETQWRNSKSDRYFSRYIQHIVPMKYLRI